MAYTVTFEEDYRSAELTHTGEVDGVEILASRIDLAACANANTASGALINILASDITASPVAIIDNVEGLLGDLKHNAKLAFVARAEAQDVVSMIVATVAHKSGFKVGQFTDLEKARCWVAADWLSAEACGCAPEK